MCCCLIFAVSNLIMIMQNEIVLEAKDQFLKLNSSDVLPRINISEQYRLCTAGQRPAGMANVGMSVWFIDIDCT